MNRPHELTNQQENTICGNKWSDKASSTYRRSKDCYSHKSDHVSGEMLEDEEVSGATNSVQDCFSARQGNCNEKRAHTGFKLISDPYKLAL